MTLSTPEAAAAIRKLTKAQRDVLRTMRDEKVTVLTVKHVRLSDGTSAFFRHMHGIHGTVRLPTLCRLEALGMVENIEPEDMRWRSSEYRITAKGRAALKRTK